jgi:hypothetical protein
MKLSSAEMLFLNEVERAGVGGVVWNARNQAIANMLIKKGLIECRFGPTVETDKGRRTGLRFVAVSEQKLQLE